MANTFVYFNLHKHVWSLQVRGIVQEHSEMVLIRNAEFVVRKAGHAKVLAEKRKNVHAFVKGENVTGQHFFTIDDGVEVSYNPYKGAHFFRKDTGEVVEGAGLVAMTLVDGPDGKKKGKVVAFGLK